MSSAEAKGGQPTGDTFISKSETAFNALREKLKSNPNLDFINGFHVFPQIKLSENNTHYIAEELLMFVSPKTPILKLNKMSFFLGDLALEFAQDPEVGLMNFKRPSMRDSMFVGQGFWVGGLQRIEDIGTVQEAISFNNEHNSVLYSLPNVDTSPIERSAKLQKITEILVFPDRISAMEGVERYKSGDSDYKIMRAEQIKQLNKRNKKGVIGSILHRSAS